jgi:membrane protein required for colicin V production
VVDWVLLAIFVLLAVRGWMRGLVREAIGLAVVVAGLFVSFRLSTPVGQIVESLLGTSADVSRLIAGIVIILVIGIAATIVANVLHYGIKLMPGLSTLNRSAGVVFSVLAGVLVVVVIVSVLSLLPLPRALSTELESSTIVDAATDPEGAAQQTIGVIAGDRVVAVVLEIQNLFGESLMIGPDSGSVRIPAADEAETRPAERAADNVFSQLNRTRAQNDAAPLVRSEVLDELAVARATELYVAGRLSDRSSDGRFVFVDLQAAGIPVQQADQVVALASSPRSASEGLAADAASLEEMVDRNHLRAGVGVVKGPLGLLVVIVLAD